MARCPKGCVKRKGAAKKRKKKAGTKKGDVRKTARRAYEKKTGRKVEAWPKRRAVPKQMRSMGPSKAKAPAKKRKAPAKKRKAPAKKKARKKAKSSGSSKLARIKKIVCGK